MGHGTVSDVSSTDSKKLEKIVIRPKLNQNLNKNERIRKPMIVFESWRVDPRTDRSAPKCKNSLGHKES